MGRNTKNNGISNNGEERKQKKTGNKGYKFNYNEKKQTNKENDFKQ